MLEQQQEMIGKPPFVDNESGVSLPELNQFLIDLDISDKERGFARDIWKNAHSKILSIHTIARVEQKTPDTIRKRLEKLVDLGVFQKHEKKYDHSNKPVMHYRFRCYQAKTEVLRPSALPSFQPGNKLMLDDKLQEQLKDPRIDDLVCTVLFAALPCRRLRKAPKSELTTTINWFEQRVLTHTRVATGKLMASVADLRIYIACLTLCHEIVQQCLLQGNPIENVFALDVRDINAFLGRENIGGNIDSVKTALDRLGATSVDVPDLPTSAIERFGFEHGSMTLHPLSNVAFFTEQRNSVAHRHLVVFHLPITVFQSMLNDRYLFIINPSVLAEKSPVLLSFHLWCRRRLGHKSSTYVTTMRRLHQDVSPTLSFTEFEKELAQALCDRQKTLPAQSLDKSDSRYEFVETGESGNRLLRCSANLHGYFLKLADGKVFVSPDARDPYVGIRSKHRKAIERKEVDEVDAEVQGDLF